MPDVPRGRGAAGAAARPRRQRGSEEAVVFEKLAADERVRGLLEPAGESEAFRVLHRSKGEVGSGSAEAALSPPPLDVDVEAIIPLSTSLACLSPNTTNRPSVGSRGHACLTP